MFFKILLNHSSTKENGKDEWENALLKNEGKIVSTTNLNTLKLVPSMAIPFG